MPSTQRYKDVVQNLLTNSFVARMQCKYENSYSNSYSVNSYSEQNQKQDLHFKIALAADRRWSGAKIQKQTFCYS